VRSKTLLISLLVLIAVADITGCRRAGKWLVRDDNPVHGDAIILLMGGISDRVLQAADLYNERKAGRLIIVEESMGGYKRLEERGVRIVSNTTQVVNAAVTLGVTADSITVVPGDAESTMTEARAIRDYLVHDNRTDTVIIVTSPTHSRRATMIFKTALNKNGRQICVLSSPSQHLGFDITHWWRYKEGIQAVIGEYVKVVSFVVVEKRRLRESVRD
jgi:uncharacterized SAM-binding protein YcdF (DUF218 family)